VNAIRIQCGAISIIAARMALADPLPVHDLNPLIANVALPVLPAAPSASLAFTASMGNISLDQTSGDEHLILDAERREWNLRYTTPVATSWTMQLDVPWVQLSGGSLDHVIESWHHTFGLPNGNRAEWPDNRLLIQHSVNGLTDLQITQSASGLGDVALHFGRSWNNAIHPVTMWLTIKAPTGNEHRLLGSGGLDVALTLSAEQQLFARLHTFEQASVVRAGNTAYLDDMQRRTVVNGLLGASLQLTTHWQFATQLNAHSAFYQSDVRALGNALQLSFGPRYSSDRWRADFAVSEDIAVDTAPDVQFALNVARRW